MLLFLMLSLFVINLSITILRRAFGTFVCITICLGVAGEEAEARCFMGLLILIVTPLRALEVACLECADLISASHEAQSHDDLLS